MDKIKKYKNVIIIVVILILLAMGLALIAAAIGIVFLVLMIIFKKKQYETVAIVDGPLQDRIGWKGDYDKVISMKAGKLGMNFHTKDLFIWIARGEPSILTGYGLGPNKIQIIKNLKGKYENLYIIIYDIINDKDVIYTKMVNTLNIFGVSYDGITWSYSGIETLEQIRAKLAKKE